MRAGLFRAGFPVSFAALQKMQTGFRKASIVLAVSATISRSSTEETASQEELHQ